MIENDPAVQPGTVFPSFPEERIRAKVDMTPYDDTLARTVANDAGEHVELERTHGNQAVYRVVE